MKVSIISYDLKNVRPYDNIIVKAELAKFTNTLTSATADNLLKPFPEWVTFTLPDTTLLAVVPDATTSADLLDDVMKVIQSVGAEAERIYVAFIDPHSDVIFNAKTKPLLA